MLSCLTCSIAFQAGALGQSAALSSALSLALALLLHQCRLTAGSCSALGPSVWFDVMGCAYLNNVRKPLA